MKANSIADIFGGIVLVALATTIVTSRYTAGQITATGGAFSSILQSALGKGSISR